MDTSFTYIYVSVRLISVKQCSIHVSRAEYKVEKKIQTDYTFISTSLFRGGDFLTSGQPRNRLVEINV